MGLEMYLYVKKKGVNEIEGEIGYWRKHPDLHDYIGSLYYKKGGIAEYFNGVEYILTKEEIEEIIKLSIDRKLPKSIGGFYFGQTEDKDNDDTVKLMNEALEYMKKGYEIIYDSWW